MNAVPRNAIVQVIEFCMGVPKLHEPAKSATKILAPDLVVTATRVLSPKKCRGSQSQSIVLTYGKPNYKQREFIKICQKANETFPVNKIYVKCYAKDGRQ